MPDGKSSPLEPEPITREGVRALLWRSCWKKKSYPRQGPAQRAAAKARASGAKVTAYRCAIIGDGHWHIGHPLSWEGLQFYAAAMRWCWEHPDEVPTHALDGASTIDAMGINRNDNPPANAVDVDGDEEPATAAAGASDPDAVPAAYVPPVEQITPPKD